MKAVILAAGEGTRMRPLTASCPKVMLPVANRPVLEHILVSARDAGIDDFVCVVGYMGNVIRDYFGDGSRIGIRIDYVEQREQLGTAHAIGMAHDLVEGRFLVLNGDAIVAPPDLRVLIERTEDIVLATKELENPAGYGVVKTEGGRVARLIEKPDHVACNLVNAGIYLFPDTIFDAIRETGESVRGEYEITDSINALVSDLDIGYSMLDTWIDIGRPWNLLDANEFLLSAIETEVAGIVEPYATLNGNIRVGKGSIIRNGSYITGPAIIGENCDIGPNCFIRPGTAIGDNVRIGNAVEIKNSIVMDGTHIGHLSYVGDSVIGRGCNLGAGTKIANLRHDGRNIRAVVKGESVDTGRRKLGVVMGAGVHTGINTSINVGVMMGACMSTRPGAVVMR
ncbi:MAG: bifunctional sugar-1-phosphate nucleotidylyltransferase/acetyltransferase [Euryarchaeota archaeon]|nr:bifunctional sugar-1-phosphate nucleotidylyltransferase/acetyltransferase [Euryarchaeota archaeon]